VGDQGIVKRDYVSVGKCILRVGLQLLNPGQIECRPLGKKVQKTTEDRLRNDRNIERCLQQSILIPKFESLQVRGTMADHAGHESKGQFPGSQSTNFKNAALG